MCKQTIAAAASAKGVVDAFMCSTLHFDGCGGRLICKSARHVNVIQGRYFIPS